MSRDRIKVDSLLDPDSDAGRDADEGDFFDEYDREWATMDPLDPTAFKAAQIRAALEDDEWEDWGVARGKRADAARLQKRRWLVSAAVVAALAGIAVKSAPDVEAGPGVEGQNWAVTEGPQQTYWPTPLGGLTSEEIVTLMGIAGEELMSGWTSGIPLKAGSETESPREDGRDQ